MKLEIGSNVYVQSFKHDGSLHRTWSKGTVLEDNETRTVLVTYKAWVIEADGRKWYTREPAVCFLYKKQWFNVISMLRKAGVFYYCNLASPSLVDEEAIKNIDYDLDLKVYPDGHFDILDRDEFEDHQVLMHYGEDVVGIVEKSMQDLIHRVETKKSPFNVEEINRYYSQYLRLVNKEPKK